MLRRINDALPGLVSGIVIYGILVQAVGVWFAEDKTGYTIGLWYGIAIAIGMAVNMAAMIYDAVAEDVGGRSNRKVIAKSVSRYLVVVILFAILGYFDFGNLFTAFLGMLGLKFSAYLQPILAKTGLEIFSAAAVLDEEEMALVPSAASVVPAASTAPTASAIPTVSVVSAASTASDLPAASVEEASRESVPLVGESTADTLIRRNIDS